MSFKKQFKEELINKNVWYCLHDTQIESVASVGEQQLQLYLVSYRRELLKAYEQFKKTYPLVELEEPEWQIDKFISLL